MSEIPEDVMKAAKKAIGRRGISNHSEDSLTLSIARAIMAERERCAKIADKEAMNGCGCNPVALGERVAERIRGGDTQ